MESAPVLVAREQGRGPGWLETGRDQTKQSAPLVGPELYSPSRGLHPSPTWGYFSQETSTQHFSWFTTGFHAFCLLVTSPSLYLPPAILAPPASGSFNVHLPPPTLGFSPSISVQIPEGQWSWLSVVARSPTQLAHGLVSEGEVSTLPCSCQLGLW